MKKYLVTVHASLDFKQEMVDAKKILGANENIQIILPELTRYQHIRDEYGDDETFTKIKNRLTKDNMLNVEKGDCVFILNYDHRGFKNYIGGNSFMEMVVAFYLGKPIYLLNPIPENMPYTEEIKALCPTVVYSIEELMLLLTPPS